MEPYSDDKGDPIGPHRVWLKTQDYPGLAMSRSFGDEVAASVGVIAHPEIMEWKLTEYDKFVILASDGLWEFIESSEVIIFFLFNYKIFFILLNQFLCYFFRLLKLLKNII